MTRSRNSRKAIVAERPGPHGCPTCCRALEKMLAIALQEIPPFNVDAIKRAIIEYFDADEAAEAAMGDAVSVSYPGSTYGVGVGDDGQLCTFPIANPRRCSHIMTLAGWWHKSGWLRSAEYLESEFAG